MLRGVIRTLYPSTQAVVLTAVLSINTFLGRVTDFLISISRLDSCWLWSYKHLHTYSSYCKRVRSFTLTSCVARQLPGAWAQGDVVQERKEWGDAVRSPVPQRTLSPPPCLHLGMLFEERNSQSQFRFSYSLYRNRKYQMQDSWEP